MSPTVARTRTNARRVSATVIATATAALLLTACAGQGTAASQASPGQNAPLASAGSETPTAPAGTGEAAVAALERSVPTKVTIPSLGVSSELETLGQNAEGAMTTP
ncbi:hypothetical protein ABZ372_22725, partial [Streptomyces sp. NPDC005921]